MAPPSIGVTGTGSRLPAPDLPSPTKAYAQRLSGYAAYYQSKPPSLTSDGSLLAAARRREEEMRLAAERARALAAQQQLPSILDIAAGPFARTPGPWAAGEAPSEIEAAKQEALNTPKSVPVDTQGVRPGPERPGYRQEKVFEGSKQVGWRYVVDGNAATAGWSAADAYANNNWMERNVSVDPASVSDVATRHYTNDKLVEADQRGYEGTDDWRDLGPYVRQMASEVYGTPVEKTNAWGETYWEFPTDKKFLGIPDEWAQRGWMPATTPKAPGPDASFEEQMAYRQKLRQSLPLAIGRVTTFRSCVNWHQRTHGTCRSS
jgi:hypothetical protein